MVDVSSLFVSLTNSIRDAATRIELTKEEIALVVDESQALLDIITDEDIRKVALGNIQFDDPISTLIGLRESSPMLVAEVDTPEDVLLTLLRQHNRRHVILVDRLKRPLKVLTVEQLAFELIGPSVRPIVLISSPTQIPEPHLHRAIDHLYGSGIHKITVVDKNRDPEIYSQASYSGISFTSSDFVNEFAVLAHTENESILVVDVASEAVEFCDFKRLITFHRSQNTLLTVVTRRVKSSQTYDIVDIENGMVKGIAANQPIEWLENAGIYIYQRIILNLFPKIDWTRLDILVSKLVASGHKVAQFDLDEKMFPSVTQ